MVLWCMLIIPTLGKMRQQDCRFEVNLGYSRKPCLQKRGDGKAWGWNVRREKKNQNCPIETQLWVTDLQLMVSAAGHIVDTSLNLFFWDIPDMVPWLSSESQYHTLPTLVNNARVKELSGQLGSRSLERSKETSGKKSDLKQLQHPLHR